MRDIIHLTATMTSAIVIGRDMKSIDSGWLGQLIFLCLVRSIILQYYRYNTIIIAVLYRPEHLEAVFQVGFHI